MSAVSLTSSGSEPTAAAEVRHNAEDTVRELTASKSSSKARLRQGGSASSPTGRGTRGGLRPTAGSPVSNGEDTAAEDSLSRCLVYCRLRPSTKRDFHDGGTNIVAMPDGRRVVIKDERHYDYDGTFDAKAKQVEVFDTVAVPCIQHAFSGFCAALMCYGQTGTGKSYTMCNTDPAHEGIIPRAARHIFETIRSAGGDGRKYTVTGQFVQIYRDHLGDLMVGDGKDRVDIHCDPIEGVSLTGCTSHNLSNENGFMRFYNEGNARRVVTATAMNAESSRGHTAMIIYIASESPDDPMQGRLKGKITFIDLAGYERFSKTGITSDNPIMKDEAKTINASLLALGHVVSSLSARSKHIPWRNSKLTRILQDSIGGRSRTSIILTIGPSSDHLHETTNSLQFGMRAMAVKVQAKASITVDYEKLSNKLMGLLSERDERINVLELQIASRDAERQELLDRYQQDRSDLEVRFERELAELTAAGASEEQIQKLREVHSVEVQNLQDQQAEEMDYQDEHHSKQITRLINEQKHQEAKSITAMRLAQESIVEEFQQKLEIAREGTNDDLVKTLQQLSEKDAVLASRASDTARLHAHIVSLTEQLRGLGAHPSAAKATFPETYLDVSQVEEIKTRLEGEVGRLRNKLVDLQTQLDRVTLIYSGRNEEINSLHDENQQLKERLAQSGADMKDYSMELDRLRAKRAELIDASELETLRLRMQADMDEVVSQRDALQAALEKAKEGQRAAVVASLRATAASRTQRRASGHADAAAGFLSAAAVSELSDGRSVMGDDMSDASSVFAADSVAGGGGGGNRAGYSKTNQMRNVYKKQVGRLQRQLLASCSIRNARQLRIDQLEGLLAAHGLEVPPPPVKETPPSPATPSSPPSSNRRGGPTSSIPTTATATATAANVSADAAAEDAGGLDAEVAAVLAARDEESRAHDRIIFEQEKLLSQGRVSMDYSEQLIGTLTVQLQAAGIEPAEPAMALQAFETLPVEEYATLLRDLRDCNRRLMSLLLQRGTAGGVPDPHHHNHTEEREVVMEELEGRDSQLELKDELLLEKAAMAQYMAKVSGRLISQMETLGLTPCCTLPESYQDVATMDVDQLEIQAEKQRELERRLKAEEEEKVRVNRLLSALSAERDHHSLVLRQAEEKNRELEEKEGKARQVIHRLSEEKTQRERILEETARRLTRELMQTQARLAQSESERKSSILDKIFGRLGD